jgi:serine/threonine-protein kinase
MLGQVLLGKYKVTRLLDEGGMSRIYLARQADPDRDVVVKVLKESLRADARACALLRREILITTHFRHPHAVAAYDAAPFDDVGPVLVLEYLRGVDLGQLLRRHGRFGPVRAGRLLAQLCDVLQAAHDEGIVHGDVKPGNCMVLGPGTPAESLKLMDFGIARMRGLLYIAPDELGVRGAAAAGTPEYLAPEAAAGGDADPRADLYSAGVVLYELLAGRRPFEYASADDLVRAHARLAPPTLASLGLGAELPPALDRLVQACLEKDPACRPQTARELAERYERALGQRLAVPHRPSGAFRRPAAAPAPRPPSNAEVALPPGYRTTADLRAVQQTVEAAMPEAVAVLKLKGFVSDLGGEVLESQPGLIRVRLGKPQTEHKPSSGIFRWLEGGRQIAPEIPTVTATDVELAMERQGPAQGGKLKVTLRMRPVGNGVVTAEWRSRCQQIGRELQAYLIGR